MGNLSSLFKEHFDKNLKTKQDIEDFLKDLKKYATIYRDFPWVEKGKNFSYKEWEERFFHIMTIKKVQTIVPFVLFLKDNLQENKEVYQRCLYLLEILIWFNTEVKYYNKFFAGIIKEIKSSSCAAEQIYDLVREKISDKYSENVSVPRAKERLLKIENRDATLVLFWIELYRESQNEEYRDRSELPYHFTLEHLMPQEWEPHWRHIVNDGEKAERLINQIGNMTLLRQKLNKSISNSEWRTKLKGDGGKKGIQEYTDLFITRELFGYDEWNAEAIEKRTQKLTDEFLTIWNVKIFQKG